VRPVNGNVLQPKHVVIFRLTAVSCVESLFASLWWQSTRRINRHYLHFVLQILCLCPTNTLVVRVIYARFALIDTNVNSRKCCASCRITVTVAVNVEMSPIGCRLQLECNGIWWRTGGEVNGKLANGLGSQYTSHYIGTWCIQRYYRWCAHLGCQYSTELTPPPI